MTQAPPKLYKHPVNITPTQTKHQFHREVNNLMAKSIFLAEAEAALTNAIDTIAIFTNDT